MAIDYDLQFKEIDTATVLEIIVDPRWVKQRIYDDPAKAFRSAQRTESRGIGVAFAKAYGSYFVWTEA